MHLGKHAETHTNCVRTPTIAQDEVHRMRVYHFVHILNTNNELWGKGWHPDVTYGNPPCHS